MARLVVLRFENDSEADKFIESDILYCPRGKDYMISTNHTKSATIEMMVQTPTKFCNCPNGRSWFRGPKYGWWVCGTCGKPSVGYGSNPRAIIGESVDMLEKPTKKNTEERLKEYHDDS